MTTAAAGLPESRSAGSTTWRLADADWNSWPDGLEDAEIFAQAASLGIEGIELGVYDAAVELSPARLARLARIVEETGVPVVGILLSLPAQRWPVGALRGEAERLVAQVAACARVCADLGLPVLGLWPGADGPGADGPGADGAGAVPEPAVVRALQRCVAAAQGTALALEYKPDTVVADATQALALCAEVAELGVLLDTGHAFAAGEDPAEVVGRLGDRLLHVHLGDAEREGSDDDLPCGRLHDFGPFLAALDASGFAGAASFDLYGAVSAGALTARQAVSESRDHLLSVR